MRYGLPCFRHCGLTGCKGDLALDPDLCGLRGNLLGPQWGHAVCALDSGPVRVQVSGSL